MNPRRLKTKKMVNGKRSKIQEMRPAFCHKRQIIKEIGQKKQTQSH
jgi:hypothetical protein